MKKKLISFLIGIVVLIGLGTTIAVQHNQIEKINSELVVATNNYKAYEAEASELKDKTLEFQLTVDQLNNSNDSLVRKLNSVRKDLKVKDKYIEELKYIASENQKKDSIFIKDTIFIKDVAIDTLISDEWSSLNLQLRYPNLIVADYSFKNEVSVISSVERVTVDPPKKCWLGRLFQKKHNVVKIDVIESNPYCEIKEQKFINIVE